MPETTKRIEPLSSEAASVNTLLYAASLLLVKRIIALLPLPKIGSINSSEKTITYGIDEVSSQFLKAAKLNSPE